MTVSDPNLPAPARAFLETAGWGDAAAHALAGDASRRRYVRLQRADARALLMIAPPGDETVDCPPGADEKERRALGYNAAARLAGPNLHAFVCVADALRGAGLSAPEVYAADAARGLALLEDLGDGLFAHICAPDNERGLYDAAIDVLLTLRQRAPVRPVTPHYEMMDYDALALMSEAELLIDWYWPLKHGEATPADVKDEFANVMGGLLGRLSPPHSFVLRDYHAENLLWLGDREGVARVGLIDFQDALYGSAAYDLVSLLEDARRDVAPSLAEAMIARYCDGAAAMGKFDRDSFLTDYGVLAAQRNAKILGIFARLAKRDGKPKYLDFLPRVEAHFKADLAHPALGALNAFCKRHFPALAS